MRAIPILHARLWLIPSPTFARGFDRKRQRRGSCHPRFGPPFFGCRISSGELVLMSGTSRHGPHDPPAHRHKKKEAAHDERERPKSREETPKEGYTARRQSLPYELEDVGALRNNQGIRRHFLAYQIQLDALRGLNVAKPTDLPLNLNLPAPAGSPVRICPARRHRRG